MQLQQELKLLLFPIQHSELRPTSCGKDESKPTSVICSFANQSYNQNLILFSFVRRIIGVFNPVAHFFQPASYTISVIFFNLVGCEIGCEMRYYFAILEKVIAHQNNLCHGIGLGAIMSDFVFCSDIIKTVGLVDGVAIYIVNVIATVQHQHIGTLFHVFQRKLLTRLYFKPFVQVHQSS